MFDNELSDLRQFFFNTWRKYKNQEALGPIEEQLLPLILAHPEYHFIFENPDAYLNEQKSTGFTENPFLHLALHQSLLEQLSTDRPPGICEVYKNFVDKYGDAHQAEHQIMEVLGFYIWQAIQSQGDFDMYSYLEELKRLLGKFA
jgi:hypothetical protein